MSAQLAAWLALPEGEALTLLLIVLLAGIVRGFSGFGLSALTMAAAALIVPPVQLIPALWFVELTANLLLMKGGFRDGDLKVALPLFIGGTAGWPLGLFLTTSVSTETSRLVALLLVAALAALQLANIRIPAMATRPGLYGTGLLSGIASGLASIGGMVVAVYILSSGQPAARMRGSMVIYLVLGSATSLAILLAFGLMDGAALARGLVLSIPGALGVLVGVRLFTPRLALWYRPFCLALIAGLALWGVARALW